MFDQLDFIYMPSRDAAADVRFWRDVLGARLSFAVEGMGTRVAMLELGTPPPAILLAEHLEGEAPVLVFRVAELEAAMADLTGRSWVGGTRMEIPHGPICAFTAPGGQRLAVYQLTRPDAGEHFAGRIDF